MAGVCKPFTTARVRYFTLDELDEAPGITPKSRLGCQTVPDGTTDIVVEIPDWNKNYAKELDH